MDRSVPNSALLMTRNVPSNALLVYAVTETSCNEMQMQTTQCNLLGQNSRWCKQ